MRSCHFPGMFSTVAALSLFLSLSYIWLVVLVGVFVAVVSAALQDRAKPMHIQQRYKKVGVIMLTFLMVFIGYDTFNTTWVLSREVQPLFEVFGLTELRFLSVVCLTLCMVGTYVMCTLAGWIVNVTSQLLKEKLPCQNKENMIANLKTNWYFCVSAMVFFFLAMDGSLEYWLGVIIASGIMLIFASQTISMWRICKQEIFGKKIFYSLSSAGICLWNQQKFYQQTFQIMLPEKIRIIFLSVSILGAAIAFFFVYVCVAHFWREVTSIIVDTGVFRGIRVGEIIVYVTLFLATISFVTVVFAHTDAFYGTEHLYNIIYTSDSPALVKGNVYMTLTHWENDLRQPLFALFAAPFVSVPYLIGEIFSVSASVHAMLMNYVQIVMLFVANYMLTKTMKLTPVKRGCFMLLSCCTYAYLLFVLVMEQYIVVYFWLIFCLYLFCNKKKPERIVLWGAGGTLLTSMILLPSMSDKSPSKKLKEWLIDVEKYGLEFVVLMLAFCRFDVIFNLVTRISFLSKFTGKTVGITDKIFQYTQFVQSCFLAPDAGVDFTAVDHVSWQLNAVTEMNVVGVVILLLVIVGVVINKENKSSLISGGWVGLSIVVLLGLGWGMKENGVILYVLYFGWAFFVLLFQLVEKIESKMNIKFLIPTLSIGSALILVAVNIPAILEMVHFSVTYFPV